MLILGYVEYLKVEKIRKIDNIITTYFFEENICTWPFFGCEVCLKYYKCQKQNIGQFFEKK